MKTLTPTNLIADQVPLEATKFKISNTNWLCIFQDRKWLAWTKLEGDFEILGEATKTEINFNVEDYLKKAATVSNGWRSDDIEIKETNFYFDYRYKIPQPVSFLITNPREAFRSLLSSNGLYFENPMGKNRPGINDYSSLIAYQGDCKEYDELENQVIKGKLIILKRK